MKNCLVTKLKVVINNPDLPNINDLIVRFKEIPVAYGGNIIIKYKTLSNQTINIKNGKFVVNGTTLVDSITTGAAKSDFTLNMAQVSKETTIIIPNCYDLWDLSLSAYGSYLNSTEGLNLDTLRINRYSGMNLVSGMDNLTRLGLAYFSTVAFNLNTGIQNCPKLTFIEGSSSTALSGDLALLPNSLCDILPPSTFSWSSKSSSAYIMTAKDVNFGNDLDKYLIDTAQGVVPSTDISSVRRIDVNGTKTSASDAAVATLKSKGYTVKINGETL